MNKLTSNIHLIYNNASGIIAIISHVSVVQGQVKVNFFAVFFTC